MTFHLCFSGYFKCLVLLGLMMVGLAGCIDLESSDDSIEVVDDPNASDDDPENDDINSDEPNSEDEDPVVGDNYGKNTLNAKSPLAINIAPFAAWTPGWVLMDVFPKSQPWVSNLCDSAVWESGPALNLDANGWVSSLSNNQCADTLVFSSMAEHYPAGTYVVLWEGDGDLSIRWDVQPEVAHTQGTQAQSSNGLNRLTFDISAEQQTDLGIGIRIAGQASNYIKNIRMIAPGGLCGRSESELNYFKYCQTARGGTGSCAADESCFDFEDVYWDRFSDTVDNMNNPKPVFHPLYASTYQQYRAIRFMKWLRPEDSSVENWSDRVSMQNQHFTDHEKGLPIEYPLAFANLINADAYLNVPMMASDDYITQYAQLVNTNLNGHLKMYLEYGNEIFNPVTPLPYGYALEQAQLSNSGIPSGDTDLVKIAKYAGRRSGEIFDIWDNHITNASDRLVKVLVGFNPISDYTLNVLDFENSSDKADALAINGYIGPNRLFVDSVAAFDAMSVDDILQEITLGNVVNSQSSLIELNQHYITHVGYASERNLQLIAYEGGNFMQTAGAGQAVVDKFFTLNRDSRLSDAFVSNFNNFEEAGATTFFYFLNEDFWTDEGVFGTRRYQDESREEAVVFDGLMNYVESTDCWWIDCERSLPAP